MRPIATRRPLPATAALAASLALHATAIGWGWHAATSSPARPERPPVAFAVEASMLQLEGALATPPRATPPPVVVEAEEPLPAEMAPTAPDEPAPPEPTPLPAERTPSRRLDDARTLLLARVVAAAPAPDVATPDDPAPTPTPPAPPSEPGAAFRPEVPSPLPGENPAPDYPEPARRRRLQGTTLLRLSIAADGRVAACELVASSGSSLLDAAATRAALRWRFDRGPGVVEQPFTFRLATP